MTLDFTDLPNPLAGFYGQDSVFKGGDYLHDQLWYSHGVKVSARIRTIEHKTHSHPFIPKFDRSTGKWKDSKASQMPSDPFSGGAVRLFDTMRPTYSTEERFHQSLCEDKPGEGDPDLGAPNDKCAIAGPGK